MGIEISKSVWQDIVEWDVVNWSRTIKFWGKANINYANKKVLEIGSRNGGLSLYFALHGANVICSDLNGPTEKAKELHKKYGVENKVTYEAVDATDIQYADYFDIVCFKSVLGGIGYDNSKERQQTAIGQMYKALKPEGYLLFAENLVASPLHKYFRSKFIKWGNRWRYVTINELQEMLCKFQDTSHDTFGFLGAFGRSNWQRSVLGHIDNVVDRVVRENNRYICAFVDKK